jgi:hypothetical protein
MFKCNNKIQGPDVANEQVSVTKANQYKLVLNVKINPSSKDLEVSVICVAAISLVNIATGYGSIPGRGNILRRVWWYTPLIRRGLVRMIEFISS